MRHLVRHVFRDGSSVFTQMAWRRPYAGLEITTLFHDSNNLNPGSVDDGPTSKVLGQRARFENRFGGAEESVSENEKEEDQ